MKVVGLDETTLDACIHAAQRERVVITENGTAVGLLIGVKGMDEDQLRLGSSAKFWNLIAERRAEETLSREELENMILTIESADGRQ